MRKVSVRLAIWIAMFFQMGNALAQRDIIKSTIPPLPLVVCADKTTNLVFPFPMVSVDRGSSALLVQRAKGVDNILQIKAGTDSLFETNLSIVTADGGLYSFITRYGDPVQLNYIFNLSPGGADAVGKLADVKKDEARLRSASKYVLERLPVIRKHRKKKYDISLRLCGVFIQQDFCYWQFELKNESNIKFDVSQFRFFIKDQKRSKRTAAQDIEMIPIYSMGNTMDIRAQSSQKVVVVLPKFVVPQKKYFQVQLLENGGARNLLLKVRNKTILNAQPIL